jgi:inner membrane transporter RhtA
MLEVVRDARLFLQCASLAGPVDSFMFGGPAGAAFGGDAVALGSAIGALIAVSVVIVHAGAAMFFLSVLPFAAGVAVLSSVVPYTLEMQALTRLPARAVGILVSVESAMGALLGLLFLDEHPTAFQWAAIAAIIAALIGAVMGARTLSGETAGLA